MKLSELIEDEMRGHLPSATYDDFTTAITARLHECVKPLEWRLSTMGYEAKSIVGKYEVYASIMSDVWLWRDENHAALDQYQGKEADGEAAKAAAQAHYAAQIIAGLDL